MQSLRTSRLLLISVLAAIVAAGGALADTASSKDAAAEDAYLDILPKVDVPDDVQPIPGAVNEEWRSCRASWPQGYIQSQDGPEARAYRDIYGFVRAANVIASEDCSCDGKAALWDQVETVANKLHDQNNGGILSWADTKSISEAVDKLIAVAETMCGGSF